MTADMLLFASSIPKVQMETEKSLSFSTGNSLNLASVLNFVLVIRAPESSPIKHKMIYAGTKADVRKAFVGLGIEIQATDLSEVDEKEVLEKCKKISK
jgi:hypothetical protein